MKITEEYIAQSRREGWFLISSILTAVVLVVNSILIWRESAAFFVKNSTATATEISGQWLLTVDPNTSYFGHIIGYYVVYAVIAGSVVVIARKAFNSKKPAVGRLTFSVVTALASVSFSFILLVGMTTPYAGKINGSTIVVSKQLASEADFSEYSYNHEKGTLTVDGDGNGYSFDIATVEGNTFYTLKQ